MQRVGFGFDVHPFGEGRRLILGGEQIDHPLGLVGHSDADVLTHALCDALLGAAALGDIGQHFPPDDPQYKDISSLRLLEQVVRLLQHHHWRLVNADLTLVLEKPRIAPYSDKIRANLATAMQTSVDVISLKATTTEGLGFTGQGEGIAAMAVVLVEQ
ncbi:MAG: 2-C-methyl-D-erythritol 2,4-cyclodiphosphate synthase [candidate division Zixibacteria bacterium]|nr:2-C-methyl-D-erythritol 2,4-cyclodiphosphate synthase [candidate division Zixibacteria bacterium]